MPDNKLIEKVLNQIVADVESGDVTSIQELLKFVPEVNLKNYLPEGTIL